MRMLSVLALTVPCVFANAAARGADLMAQVAHYRSAHETEIVARLDELTRIKSVAADPAGLKAAADYLQEQLRSRGFETRQLITAGAAASVVYGLLKTPRARRTVVYYAHYDGQPVTPSQWSSEPFTPVMRAGGSIKDPEIDWRHAAPPFDPEWRLYARAASDDKATIVAFLAAFDALKAAHTPPTVNVKVIWEGEEEAGSEHLKQLFEENRELLAADLFLVGDGPVHQTRRPTLTFGARGTVGLKATLYGPIKALHDGHYGNWVPNPAVMAANLVAQLRDDDGHILIPGFDSDVRPLNSAERQALAAMPAVEDDLRREFAVGRTEGHETLPTSLMRPALNIRGIRSGQVGAQTANAIPVDAELSIDFRLVPEQTPDGVRGKFEAFLRDKGWTLTEHEPDATMRQAHPKLIRLTWEAGYRALRSDISSAPSKAVIAAANLAAGTAVVVMPMSGGSVPLASFDDVFHAPMVCVPIANHDNNQHAANENLRLRNLWDGITLYAALLGTLRW